MFETFAFHHFSHHQFVRSEKFVICAGFVLTPGSLKSPQERGQGSFGKEKEPGDQGGSGFQDVRQFVVTSPGSTYTMLLGRLLIQVTIYRAL